MNGPGKAQQVYGYGVCAIAVITFLICTSVIVSNAFDLANPVQAGYVIESSVSSFEAYKATYQRDQQRGGGPAAAEVRPDTLSEATLLKRYEAVRADRIGRVRFQAWKAITTSGLLLVLAVVLFLVHWRWARKGAASEGAA